MAENNHGGKRAGAGRPTKASEEDLLLRLKPLDDLAFEKLEEALQKGDQQALRLFMGYRFGQPKQTIDSFVYEGVILNGVRPKDNAKMNGTAVNGELNGKDH